MENARKPLKTMVYYISPTQLTACHLRNASAIRSPPIHSTVDDHFATPSIAAVNSWGTCGFSAVPRTRVALPLCSLALCPKPPKPKSGAGKTAYHRPPLTSSADVS